MTCRFPGHITPPRPHATRIHRYHTHTPTHTTTATFFVKHIPPLCLLQQQMLNSYETRHSSTNSLAASSMSWANPRPRRGRLLYAPLILVEEEEGSTSWSRGGGGEVKKGGAERGEGNGHTNNSYTFITRLCGLLLDQHIIT